MPSSPVDAQYFTSSKAVTFNQQANLASRDAFIAELEAEFARWGKDAREARKKSQLYPEEILRNCAQLLAEVPQMKAEKWFQQGITCLDQKDYSGARNSFQQAIEIDPRDGASWAMLGLARAKGGDRAGAIASYQQALTLLPSGKLAEETRARLEYYSKEGKLGKERDDRRQALEKFKKLLRVSRRVKLPQIGHILGYNPIIGQVVDWAAEFGFTLDGDDLDLETGRKEDFIDAIDRIFSPPAGSKPTSELLPWICPLCGQENQGNAHTCQRCGEAQ